MLRINAAKKPSEEVDGPLLVIDGLPLVIRFSSAPLGISRDLVDPHRYSHGIFRLELVSTVRAEDGFRVNLNHDLIAWFAIMRLWSLNQASSSDRR